MRDTREVMFSRRRVLEGGFVMAAGCACPPWILGEAYGVREQPAGEGEARSWKIGNDQVERALAFRPKTGLLTEKLSDVITHVDFIRPERIQMDMAQEFSFLCNGQFLKGAARTSTC